MNQRKKTLTVKTTPTRTKISHYTRSRKEEIFIQSTVASLTSAISVMGLASISTSWISDRIGNSTDALRVISLLHLSYMYHMQVLLGMCNISRWVWDGQFAAVAQLGERMTEDHKVRGSSPRGGTFYYTADSC